MRFGTVKYCDDKGKVLQTFFMMTIDEKFLERLEKSIARFEKLYARKVSYVRIRYDI